MFDSLYQMTDIKLFILLNCFSIVISLIAIFVVKYYVPLNMRYKDNTVIGNTVSLIAVIYGVLAGLSAVYLINNNNSAATAVQNEANAVAGIYRDSMWMQKDAQIIIQQAIKQYIDQVINVEWPLMEKGSTIDDVGGIAILQKITRTALNYNGAEKADGLLGREILQELRDLYNARAQRIQMSYTALSLELWVVILIGTVLTLCVNYLFGMNFYLHMLTVTAAAIMTSSMIFLLITLDKPFQGEFIIEPDGLHAVQALIDQSPANLRT